MNAMRQLDSGDGDSCIVERLEAGHRGAVAFDRAMVLLNNIVEILAALTSTRIWCITGLAFGQERPEPVLVQVRSRKRSDSRLGGRQAQASARSHSTFSDRSRRGRPAPNENCRFLMRCASSIPVMVMAALSKDLKPAIEAHRRLIAR